MIRPWRKKQSWLNWTLAAMFGWRITIMAALLWLLWIALQVRNAVFCIWMELK